MGWNIVWLITGSMAFLLAIINLIRSFTAKNKGWQIMMFASLSCGAITILEEYQQVSIWLQHGDMAAIEDVVPTLAHMLTIALYIGIFLNLIVLLVNTKKAGK